jgi:hypothetical protein
MAEEEYQVIMSNLSEHFSQDGKTVQIEIYQDGEGGWLLEVVDEHNNSTVWDDPFPTEVAALNEAHEAIEKEGIVSFIDEKSHSIH